MLKTDGKKKSHVYSRHVICLFIYLNDHIKSCVVGHARLLYSMIGQIYVFLSYFNGKSVSSVYNDRVETIFFRSIREYILYEDVYFICTLRTVKHIQL